MHALAAFLAVATLVIVLPGQDTALVIRNTLAGGAHAGRLTAAGIASGQLVWAVATAAGLAALLRASEPAFLALRLAGAAYLVVLGGQALLAARRVTSEAPQPPPGGSRRARAGRGAFRQGLLSNLGNPKMAIFFVGLLPQFTVLGGAALAGPLLLGALFAGLTALWLCGYAAAVGRAGTVLRRPGVRRAVEGITGTVLVALGLRVAAEAR